MMTSGIWRWNDTNGGMRFAFPPYVAHIYFVPKFLPAGDSRERLFLH